MHGIETDSVPERYRKRIHKNDLDDTKDRITCKALMSFYFNSYLGEKS